MYDYIFLEYVVHIATMYDYIFLEYVVHIATKFSVSENITNAILRVSGIYRCMLEFATHVSSPIHFPLQNLQISRSLDSIPQTLRH
jgi:hypothetical protein